MKKRLRKKLRKGEFKEFGFRIKFKIDPKLSIEKIDEITWDFIIDAIEANDLMFGGGGSYLYEGFCAKVKGSATEDDIKNIEKWINGQSEILDYEIGELIDAWH